MLVPTKLVDQIYVVTPSLFQAGHEQLGTRAKHSPHNYPKLLIVGLGNPGKHYDMTRYARHCLFVPAPEPFNKTMFLN